MLKKVTVVALIAILLPAVVLAAVLLPAPSASEREATSISHMPQTAEDAARWPVALARHDRIKAKTITDFVADVDARRRAARYEQALVRAQAIQTSTDQYLAALEAERQAAAIAAEAARVAQQRAQASVTVQRAQTNVPAPTQQPYSAPASPAPQPVVRASGGVLSGEQIRAAAAAAGWDASQLDTVVRVATCESSGNPAAVAPAGYVGLMQVAPWFHGAVPSDPVAQMAQALAVHQKQGWGAWGCY